MAYRLSVFHIPRVKPDSMIVNVANSCRRPNLCNIFCAFSLLMSIPSSARDCWISEASMRPATTLEKKKFKHVAVQKYEGCIYRQTRAPPTIIVSVQALEREAQLLLVILQVLGELVEVQTPVLVLIARGHDFLRTEKRILLARFCGISVTRQSNSAGIACKRRRPSPGTPIQAPRDPHGHRSCTCAAPWRNTPIALRPARNSATSTFPSLLVSSLSNRSWYDLWLSASQHRAVGSNSVRMVWYIVGANVEAASGGQSGCDHRIHATDRWRRPAKKKKKNPDASIVIRLLNHWASGCSILQAAPREGTFFLSVSGRTAAVEGGATKAT